jgi:hypothetical protein
MLMIAGHWDDAAHQLRRPCEQRLAGLTPDQLILALPLDVLRALPEEYLRSLPVEVQQKVRKRLQGAAH